MMYLLSETEQHVRASLRDAILLLCQSGLKFDSELSVDGLLAVTVDKKHVILLDVKETLQASEPRGTGEDSACLCPDDRKTILKSSSTCPSVIAAVGSDDCSLSNDRKQECARYITGLQLPAEMCSQQTADAGPVPMPVDIESATKCERMSRRCRRKQRRSVRRIVDTSCSVASPSALMMELLQHSEHDLACTGNENRPNDLPECNEVEDKQCSQACKTELVNDTSHQQPTGGTVSVSSANLASQTHLNCGDEDCVEAVNSLRLRADQKQLESELLANPTPPNKESVTDLVYVSKRSHRKQRCTVRQCLDSGTYPETSSPSVSLTSLSQTDRIPGWVNNEIGKVLIGDVVRNERACKMELSDNLSDGTQTECQGLSRSLQLSADVKAEIVEPTSAGTEVASQLASLGAPDPQQQQQQQQLAMMSQFGLSAVVASMQSHFAVLPKPFPWPVRTFPSLSPPSLTPAPCGMVRITSLMITV